MGSVFFLISASCHLEWTVFKTQVLLCQLSKNLLFTFRSILSWSPFFFVSVHHLVFIAISVNIVCCIFISIKTIVLLQVFVLLYVFSAGHYSISMFILYILQVYWIFITSKYSSSYANVIESLWRMWLLMWTHITVITWITMHGCDC